MFGHVESGLPKDAARVSLHCLDILPYNIISYMYDSRLLLVAYLREGGRQRNRAHNKRFQHLTNSSLLIACATSTENA